MQQPPIPPDQDPPADQAQPADDHLLEDLAAMTGLFNPEVLWQQQQNLTNLKEEEQGLRPPVERD